MVGSVDLRRDPWRAGHLVPAEPEESRLNRNGLQTSQPAAQQTRAAAYGFLAGLLRAAPSESLLQEVVHGGFLTLVERIGHPTASGGDVLDPVEDPKWPAQAETIALEHARLLAVPGESSVRAYESVYCDTVTIDNSTGCSAYFSGPSGASEVTGLLHGPSTVAVRDVYQRAGFAMDPASHELPDHLAIELEFMGRLLERGMDRQAADFFGAHLGRWVFRCLDDIKRRTQVAFYRTVGDVAEGFLRFEEQAFAMVDKRHVQAEATA